jgi:hypothetical protein
MTELEAISIIKTEVEKTIGAFDVVVASRKYNGRMSIYDAQIAVVSKDDSIQPQTLVDLYEKIKNDSIEMEVLGTSLDVKDMKFEILTIEAEVTL